MPKYTVNYYVNYSISYLQNLGSFIHLKRRKTKSQDDFVFICLKKSHNKIKHGRSRRRSFDMYNNCICEYSVV